MSTLNAHNGYRISFKGWKFMVALPQAIVSYFQVLVDVFRTMFCKPDDEVDLLEKWQFMITSVFILSDRHLWVMV